MVNWRNFLKNPYFKVSGIRPEDIKDGEDFKKVQKEISDMLKGRILVGHSIHHDLKVLHLNHPKKMIRDTASYNPFRRPFGNKTPSLKNLAAKMLGVKGHLILKCPFGVKSTKTPTKYL